MDKAIVDKCSKLELGDHVRIEFLPVDESFYGPILSSIDGCLVRIDDKTVLTITVRTDIGTWRVPVMCIEHIRVIDHE